MSEQQTPAAPQDQPAPAAAPPAPKPAPAVAPVTEPDPKQPEDKNPPWLKPRLDQAKEAERNRILSELGFPDTDALRERLNKAKELEEATLTEHEKVQRRLAELEPQAQRAAELERRFKAIVDAEFNALPPHVQAAADAIAQGDPEKRSDYIAFYKASQDPNAAPPAPPAAQPSPPPANTAPPGSPPSPAPVRSKWEEWQAIPENESVRRGLFYRANRAAIELSKPAR